MTNGGEGCRISRSSAMHFQMAEENAVVWEHTHTHTHTRVCLRRVGGVREFAGARDAWWGRELWSLLRPCW